MSQKLLTINASIGNELNESCVTWSKIPIREKDFAQFFANLQDVIVDAGKSKFKKDS